MPAIELPHEPLSDRVVALRRWRAADAPAIAAAVQDPEIPRWTMVPASYTEDDAVMYLAVQVRDEQAGTGAHFAVVDAPDGPLLGAISLLRFDWAHSNAEIGYWAAAEARGRGAMTRAVRLVTAWGFAGLGLMRIAIQAAPENPASQRVAERAGFTREGIKRSAHGGKDGRHDLVVYARLPDDPD